VTLGMACGDNCNANLDIGTLLQAQEIGQWQQLDLPLACFTEAGLDPRALQSPMILETDGTLSLSLHEVTLTKAEGVGCP
jgi:beta-glucosidase